jgi:hypothetical protein
VPADPSEPDIACAAGAHDPARRFAIVDGVFAPAFCRWLLAEARRIHAAGTGFPSSNEQWDRDVVEDSAPVLVHNLAGKPHEMICAVLRQRGMLDDGEAHVLIHAWTAGSYIPWHNDGKHRGAVTVYLNDVWEPDWGGHFLHKSADDALGPALVPRFNLGVSVGWDVPHATTRVEAAAPEPRYSLQVFRRNLAG